ncbi:MAG: 50S ribosomal protein L24 [Candidatus Pacearchaeota archaeon]
MTKCFFCSKEIEPGRGIMFVTLEGKILHFCSSKCRKHFNMNRSRKQKWITKEKKK